MANKNEYSTSELEVLAITDPVKFFKIFVLENYPHLNDCETNGTFLATYVNSDLEKQMSLDVFSYALVEQQGGGEGGGEEVIRVFAIKKDDVPISYCMITGFYSSYSGTEWNNEFDIVYSHEVLVTKYLSYKV